MERTNRQTVTFLHPFKLKGVDDIQPAGAYVVETEDELIEALSFPAYRRLSTVIHLAGSPNSGEMARMVTIKPEELAAVLATDSRESSAPKS